MKYFLFYNNDIHYKIITRFDYKKVKDFSKLRGTFYIQDWEGDWLRQRLQSWSTHLKAYNKHYKKIKVMNREELFVEML